MKTEYELDELFLFNKNSILAHTYKDKINK